MIQINLIPDVKQEFLKAEKARRMAISFSIIVILAAVGLAVLLGVLWGIQSVRGALVQDGIKKEYATLSQVADVNDLVTIQNQLAHVDAIHQDKARDSRIFTILQAINPGGRNSVLFSNIKLLPEDTAISLEGTAQNGYAAVELLKKTIANTNLEYTVDGETKSEPIADSVEVGESSLGEDGSGRVVLRFTLSFVYNKQLFSSSVDTMKIVRPQGSFDLTDSRLRVPDSLFTNTAKDTENEQ
jgi:hypothetical protein